LWEAHNRATDIAEPYRCREPPVRWNPNYLGFHAAARRRTVTAMVTLHIEHPITDFDTWTAAFARFADARQNAGVRAHRVRRPIDDERYVLIDLDFDSVQAAESFRTFLCTVVWANPDNAPGLAGQPRTLLLETAPVG